MSDQTLLADVEEFLVRTGMADSALGRGAVNDWKFVRGLRAGRRVWPETEAKIRAFMVTADPAEVFEHAAANAAVQQGASTGQIELASTADAEAQS